MIKVFAFDLDGTLTQHKTPLDEKNRAILEKLGQIDKQAQSFLAEAEILVSADGRQVLIRTANAFSLMMLSKESSKNAIARAMALCRITSGPAEILVKETKKELKNI